MATAAVYLQVAIGHQKLFLHN